MFLNVLVGVDGSSSGRDAIALASRLLSRGGRLTLVHVRAPAPSAAAGPFGGGADDAREASRRLLVRERASAEVATELVSICDLAPGRGLHVQAEQREADLLVVGSCARAVAGRTMLADDTRAALNGAPCPVAIACCGYARATRPIRTVGVAYNRSRESDAALIMAREIAAATGAAVRALEVVPVMGHGFRAFVPASADERVDAMLQEAGEHMDGLLDVDGRVCYGLVGEELAAFAREVDILLVGSRGYGPCGRAMVGHTADHLERSAGCSLLLLTRDPAVNRADRAGIAGELEFGSPAHRPTQTAAPLAK